jgi:hypothetical protein
MTSNPIAAIINRSNRNRLVLSLVGIVAVLAIGILSWRYFYNFFLGPFPISRADLLATTDPGAPTKYFVTVEGDNTIDTGVQEITESSRSNTRRVTASFMALVVDDRILIVKAPSADEQVTSFTGALASMPSDVRSEIVEDAVKDNPELRDVFLPFMLDTDGFRTGGYFGLAVGIPVFLLCILGLVQAVQRSSDPLKHPIMKDLGRFGPAQQVVSEIENDLFMPHEQLGDLHLTPGWLVHTPAAALGATRLEDTVWIYKQVTQRRVNGIPAGKTYSALIFDRHGKLITIPGKNEEAVNQMLQAVLNRAPWSLAGYNQEIEKAWKSNRASVIAAVDQRRQQIRNMQAGEPVGA